MQRATITIMYLLPLSLISEDQEMKIIEKEENGIVGPEENFEKHNPSSIYM